MSDDILAQMSVAWSYAVPILQAVGSAAAAAVVWPSFAWIAAAAVGCLWLPRRPWQAAGGTWASAFAAAVVAFLVVAVIGAIVGGGIERWR